MKDQLTRKIIEKIVGLRAKAKGTQICVIKRKIKFESY